MIQRWHFPFWIPMGKCHPYLFTIPRSHEIDTITYSDYTPVCVTPSFSVDVNIIVFQNKYTNLHYVSWEIMWGLYFYFFFCWITCYHQCKYFYEIFWTLHTIMRTYKIRAGFYFKILTLIWSFYTYVLVTCVINKKITHIYFNKWKLYKIIHNADADTHLYCKKIFHLCSIIPDKIISQWLHKILWNCTIILM